MIMLLTKERDCAQEETIGVTVELAAVRKQLETMTESMKELQRQKNNIKRKFQHLESKFSQLSNQTTPVVVQQESETPVQQPSSHESLLQEEEFPESQNSEEWLPESQLSEWLPDNTSKDTVSQNLLQLGCYEGRKGQAIPPGLLLCIFEKLTFGTPPSAIPLELMHSFVLVGQPCPVTPPTTRTIRKCRSLLRVFGQTLAAYEAAKANHWKQLFFDATDKDGRSFLTVALRVVEDDTARDIHLATVYTCGKTAEEETHALVEYVFKRGRKLLSALADTVKRIFPDEGVVTARLCGH